MINSIAQKYIDKIAGICARRKPLVAIQCITYNHENYLRDALEGFLMQKTDFPFVVIVHEDVSTDGTAAVLREYAEKYPDIILPIFEEENQYSKPDGSLSRILDAALKATGAKYIALCEGDDYWIAPDKLQRQVDFLEAHPDYSASYTAFKTVDEKGNEKESEIHNENIAKSKSGDNLGHLLRENYIQTCTVVYKINWDDYSLLKNAPNRIDYSLFIYLAIKGYLQFDEEITSSYRITQSGAMGSAVSSVIELCEKAFLYYLVNTNFQRINNRELRVILKKLWTIEWKYRKERHLSTIKTLFPMYPGLIILDGINFYTTVIKNKLRVFWRKN